MAVEIRECNKCGSVIEFDTEKKAVKIRVNRNKAGVMFNVTCGECRQWISEKTSQ